MKRVFVTGIGLVTPLGIGNPSKLRKVFLDEVPLRSSILSINKENAKYLLGSQRYSNFDGDKYFDNPKNNFSAAVIQQESLEAVEKEYSIYSTKRDSKRMPLCSEYAVLATELALIDANISHEKSKSKKNWGISIGTGIGSLHDNYTNYTSLLATNYKRLHNPLFIPRLLINNPASVVSILFGCRGPVSVQSTACAAGGSSIIDGYHMIQRGEASVVIAGSTESCIDPLAIAGFQSLKALSSTGECNPFANKPHRNGFVLGEGCGMFILESEESFKERQMESTTGSLQCYAEIAGVASTMDAFSVAIPREDGSSVAECMKRALKAAQCKINDRHPKIDYINAHATGTPLGDSAEASAIQTFLQKSNNPNCHTPVSSSKATIGHLLGAAGSIEAGIALMALTFSKIPPTLHTHPQIEGNHGNIKFLSGFEAENTKMKTVMSNSFGFGGMNTSMVFTQP